jgi:SRSO17 transposase
MAARLAPSTTRTTHKKLLNFVSDGAWSDEAVLAAMRREVLPALEAHGAVRRWIVDETGMAKKGTHSVGVARQYCGELGKIENCQVLVSLSVANAVAALPVAARLYLPEAWAGDPARRDAAGVPLDVTFQTKPSIALELIGRALAGGVPPGMVLADEVYGSTAEFRRGVAGLGLDYALAVRSTTLVSPPCSGRRARLWRGQEDPLSVRALASPRRGSMSSTKASGPCWSNGRWATAIRWDTGWSRCPGTPRSRRWSPPPRTAGGSSRAIAISNRRSVSAITRDVAGGVSTTTSRSLWPPMASLS